MFFNLERIVLMHYLALAKCLLNISFEDHSDRESEDNGECRLTN